MAGESSPAESALALLEYPNRYPLKVFGRPSIDFEATVLSLIRARCPQAEHIEVSKRSSRGGKYLALTLTFTVQTQQQLEDVYRDLHECDQVVMSL
jgi:putative lipoic acid-binding regulatory protein